MSANNNYKKLIEQAKRFNVKNILINNKFFDKKAKIYEGKSYSPKVKQNDILKDELKHFFHCIKKNEKPLTDIAFATNILKCLNKI